VQNHTDNTAIMNLIKKLDRVTQWAGEKMGQETKTAASEEFKALELEMALRHDGESASRYDKVNWHV